SFRSAGGSPAQNCVQASRLHYGGLTIAVQPSACYAARSRRIPPTETHTMRTRWAAALTILLTTLATANAADDYKLGPDSQKQPGVPEGKVTKHTWKSTIFPDTVRDYWVYVPAQYDKAKPACVMVFQDGADYVNTTSELRVPIVFDNLIHKGEMPVTIGIF